MVIAQLSKVLDEDNFSILTTTCGVSNACLAVKDADERSRHQDIWRFVAYSLVRLDTEPLAARNLPQSWTRQACGYLGHRRHHLLLALRLHAI